MRYCPTGESEIWSPRQVELPNNYYTQVSVVELVDTRTIKRRFTQVGEEDGLLNR